MPRVAGGPVLVVGGSPMRPSAGLVRRLAGDCSLVVACDSGAIACLDAGVGVDVLVGDHDSITQEALDRVAGQGARVLTYPADKDHVDLALAVGHARAILAAEPPARADAPRLVMTGVSGARPDHALAALGEAVRAADLGCSIWEDDFHTQVLAVGGLECWRAGERDLGRTLSVLAPAGPCRVSERGTRWECEGLELEPLSGRGVSNVVERLPAWVRVESGCALVTVMHQVLPKVVAHVPDTAGRA